MPIMAPYENPTPTALLQKLIQIETINPPGNEARCIDYVDGLLQGAGIATTILGRTPERTNLIARLIGRGDAPPLLLYGHVDVVPVEGQDWSRDPFSGDLVDGYVWGRGAIDMKGADAMMLSVFLRAHAEGTDLPGDVILCLVSDEEDGGEYGARWLVENHPEQFEGVRYALGEGGGIRANLMGQAFYPIMLGEKRVVTMDLHFRGAGGHGAMRHPPGAMHALGQALRTLTTQRLPVHITPVAESMIRAMASALGEPVGAQMLALLDPAQTDAVLDQGGAALRSLDPLLHNMANPTRVSGGSADNVIPSDIKLTLDGRALPGISTETMLAEVRALIDAPDIEMTLRQDGPMAPDEPDMGLFHTLGSILTELDTGSHPVPYLVMGATDARFFNQLGIQTYGFMPMNLRDSDEKLLSTMHAADERVPVSALEFGTQALWQALQRFGA